MPPIAKILAQIEDSGSSVSIEIFAQPKGKEPSNDAMSRFLAAYTSQNRVGTLTKESYTGKLVSEWSKLVSESSQKPELVDMAPSVSAFMAVKDEEELVSVTRLFLRHTHLEDRKPPKLPLI